MSTSVAPLNAPDVGLFGRLLGVLKAAAAAVGSVVRKAVAFVAGTATAAAVKVASVTRVARAGVAEKLSRAGLTFSKVSLHTVTACCLTATVLLFTTGLPALVVVVAGLLVAVWLAWGAWDYVSNQPTGEARAQAALHLSAVAFLGAVLLAVTISSPALGCLAVCCATTGLIFRLACSDEGRLQVPAAASGV